MLIQKTYYFLKPVIPWVLRSTVRRWLARSRRIAYSQTWPIDQRAGTAPPRWPGWPDGKRFALVLTHDVEGSKGLARVERLMRLELEHGFRSSFNLVPEGEYRVSESLRHALDRAGFEVGVHGLKHDGKLYNSTAGFAVEAARIREYLAKWNVSGFRSPFMQHRLAWLHQLGVEYDCSTFDTDPFEPEPDGTGTIFPFWVPGPKGGGYVELPYTLPQDFVLFKVLGEPTIDTWKRKLDWIAEQGGMALLNTHPDYMCFDGAKGGRDEYPVSYYEEFLSYVRQKYDGKFWSAKPRDVARFYCAELPPALRNSRKKICMVTHSSYESDNRVRRYAEALVKRGDQVDVISLGSDDVPLGLEEISGVNVYRVQHRERNERGKWMYAWRLLRFLFTSSVLLARRHRRLRYDLIHVHNVPDFLVFTACYPKWSGAKLILDIHDIVPELFASKFNANDKNGYVGLLKAVERASAAFVDHVIVSNDLWYDKLILRSVPKEKCSVFLNHVDPDIFYRRRRTRNDDKVIVIFPGSLQWHQGLDIAIKAFARFRSKMPNAEFHFYGVGGGGSGRAELDGLADGLGLNGSVKFYSGLPIHRIPDIMVNADLGVVPKRADSFGNEAYSTKIMEFMSQGVPVVVSRTKVDTFYFDETVVRFFESGNDQAMADAMLEVVENKALRNSLISKGYEYVDRHSWDRRKNAYLKLVDGLTTEAFDDSEATAFLGNTLIDEPSKTGEADEDSVYDPRQEQGSGEIHRLGKAGQPAATPQGVDCS